MYRFSPERLGPFLAILAVVPAVAWSQSPAMSARTEQLQARVEVVAEQLRLQKDTGVMGEPEFRRRFAALGDALDAWNQSSRQDADADIMQAWLDQASGSAMIGSRKPMPVAPDFPERMAEPEPLAAKLPEPAATAVPAPAPQQATDPPEEWIPIEPVIEPPMETPMVVETATPDDFDLNEASDSIDVAPAEESTAEEWLAETPLERFQAEATQNDSTPPEQETLAWSDHPAAPRIDWGDPFADDEHTPGDSPTMENRFKPVSRSPQGDELVKIDLLELSSRVAGQNSRLRELEGLLIGSRNMSAFRLAAIVRDLEEQLEQRSFLDLYLAGLSPEDKKLGPELESLETIQQLLRRIIDQRSEDLSTQVDSRAQAERDILGSLYRKLAEFESSL